MSKMIQIRNVPDEMHRALKVRAANEGLSLSDFIKRELEPTTTKLGIGEIYDRARARDDGPPSTFTTEDVVRIIRDMRGD